MIAYCGLDCEKCDAKLATVNSDDNLREKTARLLSELNGIEITKEMINCMGCRSDGVKTYFCDSMCEIRKCAMTGAYKYCGECGKLETCEKIKMIISNNTGALENLKRSGNR